MGWGRVQLKKWGEGIVYGAAYCMGYREKLRE
jgi:hypothetical protein